MLSYHPAFDPYHSAFRTLRLLSVESNTELHHDAVRILDFYSLFPHLIERATLPREQVRFKRRFRDRANKYFFSGEPKTVFDQIRLIHDAGLRLLLAKGLVDTAAFRSGVVKLRRPLTGALAPMVDRSVSGDRELLEFLVSGLGSLPTTGPQGLKARSGLLDFRYDAT